MQGCPMLANGERAGWFILLTEPQRECTASAHMIGRGIKVYSPQFRKRCRVSRRATRNSVRPLFPGYIFVDIDYDKQKHRVEATPGVRRFMRSGDGLALVAPALIFALRDQEQAAVARVAREQAVAVEYGRIRAVHTIHQGEQIRLNQEAGPFAGLYGKLAQSDEGDRIRILLSLFGRETSMMVDADAIEPV